MGRTYTTAISPMQLKKKVEDATGEFDKEWERIGPLMDLPAVKKDLSKVDFGTENAEFEEALGDGAEGIVGYHQLPNGFSYLGVTAGGDWEHPIFFIIYWDGDKLRGYIPKDGNPWNTDNNSAYGNEEESDVKNVKKRGFDGSPDDGWEGMEFDSKAIIDDIMARIVYTGTSAPTLPKAVDEESEFKVGDKVAQKGLSGKTVGTVLSVRGSTVVVEFVKGRPVELPSKMLTKAVVDEEDETCLVCDNGVWCTRPATGKCDYCDEVPLCDEHTTVCETCGKKFCETHADHEIHSTDSEGAEIDEDEEDELEEGEHFSPVEKKEFKKYFDKGMTVDEVFEEEGSRGWDKADIEELFKEFKGSTKPTPSTTKVPSLTGDMVSDAYAEIGEDFFDDYNPYWKKDPKTGKNVQRDESDPWIAEWTNLCKEVEKKEGRELLEIESELGSDDEDGFAKWLTKNGFAKFFHEWRDRSGDDEEEDEDEDEEDEDDEDDEDEDDASPPRRPSPPPTMIGPEAGLRDLVEEIKKHVIADATADEVVPVEPEGEVDEDIITRIEAGAKITPATVGRARDWIIKGDIEKLRRALLEKRWMAKGDTIVPFKEADVRAHMKTELYTRLEDDPVRVATALMRNGIKVEVEEGEAPPAEVEEEEEEESADPKDTVTEVIETEHGTTVITRPTKEALLKMLPPEHREMMEKALDEWESIKKDIDDNTLSTKEEWKDFEKLFGENLRTRLSYAGASTTEDGEYARKLDARIKDAPSATSLAEPLTGDYVDKAYEDIGEAFFDDEYVKEGDERIKSHEWHDSVLCAEQGLGMPVIDYEVPQLSLMEEGEEGASDRWADWLNKHGFARFFREWHKFYKDVEEEAESESPISDWKEDEFRAVWDGLAETSCYEEDDLGMDMRKRLLEISGHPEPEDDMENSWADLIPSKKDTIMGVAKEGKEAGDLWIEADALATEIMSGVAVPRSVTGEDMTWTLSKISHGEAELSDTTYDRAEEWVDAQPIEKLREMLKKAEWPGSSTGSGLTDDAVRDYMKSMLHEDPRTVADALVKAGIPIEVIDYEKEPSDTKIVCVTVAGVEYIFDGASRKKLESRSEAIERIKNALEREPDGGKIGAVFGDRTCPKDICVEVSGLKDGIIEQRLSKEFLSELVGVRYQKTPMDKKGQIIVNVICDDCRAEGQFFSVTTDEGTFACDGAGVVVHSDDEKYPEGSSIMGKGEDLDNIVKITGECEACEESDVPLVVTFADGTNVHDAVEAFSRAFLPDKKELSAPQAGTEDEEKGEFSAPQVYYQPISDYAKKTFSEGRMSTYAHEWYVTIGETPEESDVWGRGSYHFRTAGALKRVLGEILSDIAEDSKRLRMSVDEDDLTHMKRLLKDSNTQEEIEEIAEVIIEFAKALVHSQRARVLAWRKHVKTPMLSPTGMDEEKGLSIKKRLLGFIACNCMGKEYSWYDYKQWEGSTSRFPTGLPPEWPVSWSHGKCEECGQKLRTNYNPKTPMLAPPLGCCNWCGKHNLTEEEMLDNLHCKGCWELFDSWWNSMDPTERRRWMGRFSSSVFSEDDLYHLSGYEWNELSSKEQTKIFGLREIARDGYFKKQLQLNTPMLSIFGLVTMLGPLFYFYFRRGR